VIDSKGLDVLPDVVRRATAGDDRAWEWLVDQYGAVLRWVCVRHGLGRSDTEDAMQTTWLACVEHLHTLRDPVCLPAWLLTTCRRACLRQLRLRNRFVLEDSTDVMSTIAAIAAPDADPVYVVARDDSAAHLVAALDELPGRQRDVLLALLDTAGTDYEQASRRLGMPVGSLGPTRRRALARLHLDPRLQVVG
jgi:RNA polymerase sigma factor (sigma-70 family)